MYVLIGEEHSEEKTVVFRCISCVLFDGGTYAFLIQLDFFLQFLFQWIIFLLDFWV